MHADEHETKPPSNHGLTNEYDQIRTSIARKKVVTTVISVLCQGAFRLALRRCRIDATTWHFPALQCPTVPTVRSLPVFANTVNAKGNKPVQQSMFEGRVSANVLTIECLAKPSRLQASFQLIWTHIYLYCKWFHFRQLEVLLAQALPNLDKSTLWLCNSSLNFSKDLSVSGSPGAPFKPCGSQISLKDSRMLLDGAATKNGNKEFLASWKEHTRSPILQA